MTILDIAFSNPEDETKVFPLRYQVRSTPVASRWVTHLEDELARNTPIEQHRLRDRMVNGHFVGVPNTGRTPESLAQGINECIDIVNAHSPGSIALRAVPDQTQKALNELHKYFEILRGPKTIPSSFFELAPRRVQRALEDFNLLIHEFEDLVRPADKVAPHRAGFVEVVFTGRWLRHPLLSGDFSHFQLALEFGDIVTQYCEVGKEILDVYHDRDTVIAKENVRPLRYLSASFECYLGDRWSEEYTAQYRASLQAWLKESGYDASDERLSIGRIVLARLIRDEHIAQLSRDAILEQLSIHSNVKHVQLLR